MFQHPKYFNIFLNFLCSFKIKTRVVSIAAELKLIIIILGEKHDPHRYKQCRFLESGSNLQLEKVFYHLVGQPISLCTSV
jgi:hypothetical protein